MNDLPILSQAQRDFVFEVDGSFREIVILQTNLPEWRLAMSFVDRLRAKGLARVTVDVDRFPHVDEETFDPDRKRFLSVEIDAVSINCHLFYWDEIEFDIDPREVRSESSVAAVLSFMRGLGDAVGRQVCLTAESAHDFAMIAYDPMNDRWDVDEG